jgi:hypothetical protein
MPLLLDSSRRSSCSRRAHSPLSSRQRAACRRAGYTRNLLRSGRVAGAQPNPPQRDPICCGIAALFASSVLTLRLAEPIVAFLAPACGAMWVTRRMPNTHPSRPCMELTRGRPCPQSQSPGSFAHPCQRPCQHNPLCSRRAASVPGDGPLRGPARTAIPYKICVVRRDRLPLACLLRTPYKPKETCQFFALSSWNLDSQSSRFQISR